MRRPRARDPRLLRALVALCVTEITSWGILYYALPVAAQDITATEGWSHGQVFTAFSAGLLLSAVAGAGVGRLLDRYGPRPVMTLGGLVGALGLLLVASAPSLPVFFVAWLVTGLAQSATLYPPAFTAVTRWYGEARTWPLTAITLVGGLASTVFAPLTDVLVQHLGWRDTYLVLAVVYVAVTVPLHALLLTPPWPGHPAHGAQGSRRRVVRLVVRGRRFLTLQASLTLTGLALFAVTLNLIPLLTDRGFTHAGAAVAFGLVGAGQVAGRVAFAVLPAGSSPHVRTVAIGTAAVVTLSALGVLPGPAVALVLVSLVAGAVRGAYTLLQATAVSDRWGTRYFGALNGAFSVPITAAIALAPATGALVTDLLGSHTAATLFFAGMAAVGLLVGRRA
ncbi:MAG: MFS transporter [Actinomycetota bacterium]|nr:MFS transporter [Actinomycetota bacterium]